MSEILTAAIRSVQQAQAAWCHAISANDTGKTGSHQSGFYIPKCAASLLFDKPGVRGENKERSAEVKWQNDFSCPEAHLKYYGRGTRDEYRITNLGRDFPFLDEDFLGSLLVLAKHSDDYYEGFVLSADEDIDDFHAYFNLAPGTSNQLIGKPAQPSPEERIAQSLLDFALKQKEFPNTHEMSAGARRCYNEAFSIKEADVRKRSDDILLGWIDAEYSLFQQIERRFYQDLYTAPLGSLDKLVSVANEVLNRRKARAGKSLEHHLATIFTCHRLQFEEQAITEEKKRPDFLFPDSEHYRNLLFPGEGLTMLGAKTTCKDRWRQVLQEADRIEHKYLFTLQQGISGNQLAEMRSARLTLVVPQSLIKAYPEYHPNVISLGSFISTVKEQQRTYLN